MKILDCYITAIYLPLICFMQINECLLFIRGQNKLLNCQWIAVLWKLGKLNNSYKDQGQFILTRMHMLDSLKLKLKSSIMIRGNFGTINTTINFTFDNWLLHVCNTYYTVYIETDQKNLVDYSVNENNTTLWHILQH